MGRTIVDISPSPDGFVAGHGVIVEEPFGSAGRRPTSWSGWGDTEPSPFDMGEAERMFGNTGGVPGPALECVGAMASPTAFHLTCLVGR
ncbi:hypothetical protein [Spirillospora sp. CA-294931]|uniref:hypothetical protein n=1 Tax=Spirillospora sp. CA-294931 TaxID=3240042 RepID=UPI003D8E177F